MNTIELLESDLKSIVGGVPPELQENDADPRPIPPSLL